MNALAIRWIICRRISATAAALAGLITAAGSIAGVLGTSAPVNPSAPSIAPVSDARKLFILHCAGCHGQDGLGSGPTGKSGVPDLHLMGALLRVPGGREFLIQVPGVMGSGLDDAQVAAVSNWMLERFVPLAQRTNTAPYTPADVRQARLRPLTDVMRTRQALLDAAP